MCYFRWLSNYVPSVSFFRNSHSFESLPLVVFSLKHITCLCCNSTLGEYFEESIDRSMISESNLLDAIVFKKFNFIAAWFKENSVGPGRDPLLPRRIIVMCSSIVFVSWKEIYCAFFEFIEHNRSIQSLLYFQWKMSREPWFLLYSGILEHCELIIL